MKKIIILFLFFGFHFSYSQLHQTKVILLNGDIINGFSERDNQLHKITIFKGEKKISIDYSSISVLIQKNPELPKGYDVYHFKKNSKDNTFKKLFVEENGDLILYNLTLDKYFNAKSTLGRTTTIRNYSTREYYICKKEDSIATFIGNSLKLKSKIKKNLRKYFEKNENLVHKINNDFFKKDGVVGLVKFYNNNLENRKDSIPNKL